MSHPVQLSELRIRVRQAADCEVGASAARILDSELDRYINESCKYLYDKLIEARGRQYYRAEASVSTTAGTSAYTWSALSISPAASPRTLLGVVLTDGSQGAHPLDAWEDQQWAELKRREAGGAATSIYDCYYAWLPASITILPKPRSSSWTLYLHYIPAMVELSGPTDTFDGINGWEEFVVVDAGIKCARKDEDSAILEVLGSQRVDLLAHIQGMAGNRDQARPYQIQDIRGDWFRPRRRDRWRP